MDQVTKSQESSMDKICMTWIFHYACYENHGKLLKAICGHFTLQDFMRPHGFLMLTYLRDLFRNDSINHSQLVSAAEWIEELIFTCCEYFRKSKRLKGQKNGFYPEE
eukprot:Sdes_comp14210_c0_seq1m3424